MYICQGRKAAVCNMKKTRKKDGYFTLYPPLETVIHRLPPLLDYFTRHHSTRRASVYLSLYRTLWRNTENLPYLCPSDTLWVSSIIPERSRRGALATTLRSDCTALSFRSGTVEELYV
jgi:hypothetical protein